MSRFFSIILFIAGLFFIGGEAQAVFCKIKCGLCQHNRGFESCLACHKGDLESLKGKERNCWAKRQKYLESQKEKLHQLHSHLSQVAEQVNENPNAPALDVDKPDLSWVIANVKEADSLLKKTKTGEWVNALEDRVRHYILEHPLISNVEKTTLNNLAAQYAPYYQSCIQQYAALRQSKLRAPRAELVSCLNVCKSPFEHNENQTEFELDQLMATINGACIYYFSQRTKLTMTELLIMLSNKKEGYYYTRYADKAGYYKIKATPATVEAFRKYQKGLLPWKNQEKKRIL